MASAASTPSAFLILRFIKCDIGEIRSPNCVIHQLMF